MYILILNRIWVGTKFLNDESDFTGNFYLVFTNSDPNLTQTQIFTLKTNPKPSPNPNSISNPNKINEKRADEYFSFPKESVHFKRYIFLTKTDNGISPSVLCKYAESAFS